MSSNVDQESPTTKDNNTDATNNREENDDFQSTKFLPILWIKSTPPDLFEEKKRWNSHCYSASKFKSNK